MNRTPSESEYMTVSEMQRYLNISQGAAYGLTHRKDFPVCHFGSIIRIPRSPFLAWVAANTSNPNSYGSGAA